MCLSYFVNQILVQQKWLFEVISTKPKLIVPGHPAGRKSFQVKLPLLNDQLGLCFSCRMSRLVYLKYMQYIHNDKSNS